MRSLKCLVLGLLLASPAVYALSGGTGNHRQRQGAADQRNECDRARTIDLGRARVRHPRRLAYLLAQSRRFRAGHQTRLDAARGFTAGDIVWTTPHRFEIAPLVNYGYAKHAMHLVKITAADSLKSGAPLELSAKASWLVCADVCIPENAVLKLQLPVNASGGGIDPAVAPLFAAARADLPSAAPAASEAKIDDGQLVLTLGKAWGATLSRRKVAGVLSLR